MRISPRRAAVIGAGLGLAIALLGLASIAYGLPGNYQRSLANVLVSEGGFSNDAHDPGGVTLNGIIQTEYNRYRRDKGLPAKALTRAMLGTSAWIAERDEIYHINYADPMAFDAQPSGLDFTLLDYGINSGIGRSGKVLRRVLGMSDSTWHVTPDVLAEVHRRDAKVLIRAINDERLHFLKGLSTWRYFGTGWARRVASVRAISLSMAGGLKGSGSLFRPAYGPGKAFDDEAMGIIP